MKMITEFVRTRGILARNVTMLRQSLGLTQEGASNLAGMNWRHWQKIEAAEVNVTILTLARLSQALRIKIPDLLTSGSVV